MRPLLLDLFCGAGGAGMGYARAGFDVVGVDKEPQPNYPFPFIRADALALPVRLERVAVIHASPPCQRHAPVTRWRGRAEDHPDLIEPTRRLLESSGLPWVMENVPQAPIFRQPSMGGGYGAIYCGSTFGLRIRRHRAFESSFPLAQTSCGRHAGCIPFDHGGTETESAYRDALGCEWMAVREARQAIPPAMTEFIGSQMLGVLGVQEQLA